MCQPATAPGDIARTLPRRKTRSLAGYIDRLTKNSRTVARFMVNVMEDESQHMAHRLQAASWLVDRSQGKAVERSVMLKIESDPGQLRIASSLPDDALADLIRGLAAPREQPALTTAGNTPVRWHSSEEGVLAPGSQPTGIGQVIEAELTTREHEENSEEIAEVLGQAVDEDEGGIPGARNGSPPAPGGPSRETKTNR